HPGSASTSNCTLVFFDRSADARTPSAERVKCALSLQQVFACASAFKEVARTLVPSLASPAYATRFPGAVWQVAPLEVASVDEPRSLAAASSWKAVTSPVVPSPVARTVNPPPSAATAGVVSVPEALPVGNTPVLVSRVTAPSCQTPS